MLLACERFPNLIKIWKKYVIVIKMYCFKCKTKTETSNITKVTSKNNRQMMKGICSKCDTRK